MLVAQCTPDMLGVMETWRTDDIKDAEVAIPGYYMLCRDCTAQARSGRAVLYIV